MMPSKGETTTGDRGADTRFSTQGGSWTGGGTGIEHSKSEGAAASANVPCLRAECDLGEPGDGREEARERIGGNEG